MEYRRTGRGIERRAAVGAPWVPVIGKEAIIAEEVTRRDDRIAELAELLESAHGWVPSNIPLHRSITNALTSPDDGTTGTQTPGGEV